MPYSNRVLVIDDRPEDGEAVARRLWQDQVPNCFIKYDEHTLENINNTFHGIRVIFQDIKLIPGTGTPNNADYGAAAQLLDSLLKENNGPWLMVAWSTWAEDPEEGQLYAQQLFDYLLEKLPVGKSPRDFIVLDKKPYTVDGDHGVVKSEEGDNSLSVEDKQDFLEKVKSSYEKSSPINALSQWERDVGSCASSVVNELWAMTKGLAGVRDEELVGLLLKLAQAQDSRHGDDISNVLYEILASLLTDRLGYIDSNPISFDVKEYSGSVENTNTMLHWDGVAHEFVNSPGAIYFFPLDGDASKYFIEPSNDSKKEFIYNNFIENNGDKGKSIKNADKDKSFDDNIQLILLDATPPCDHDNNKAIWRKMIVGIKVQNNETTTSYLKHRKKEESLKDTPIFHIADEEFYFIFNSRLVITLPDNEDILSKLGYIGRIREQLLRDFVSWFGGMFTRPGIVKVI